MPQLGDPSDTNVLDCPRVIQLETTTRCNLRCTMCAAKQSPVHREDMPEELYARIVADLAGHADKIETLCLFMDGEPLLDKRLPRFIAMAKVAGLRTVSIATNGMCLTPETGDALIEAGLDAMIVSIDSLDPGTYAAIRVGGKLERVTTNVQNFMARRKAAGKGLPHVSVRLIEMPENDAERGAFRKHWQDNVDDVIFQVLHHWGSDTQNAAATDATGMRCNWPFRNMVIYSDGRAGFCCLDYEGIYRLGDFNRSTLDEIWHGQPYRELRKAMAQWDPERLPKCQHCDFTSLSPVHSSHWKKLILSNRSAGPIRVSLSFPDADRPQSTTRTIAENQQFCWGLPYMEGIVRVNVADAPEHSVNIRLEQARIYYDIPLG
jgi:MoaA/NifB/PqqE/SkfB family radical SAM enzyme